MSEEVLGAATAMTATFVKFQYRLRILDFKPSKLNYREKFTEVIQNALRVREIKDDEIVIETRSEYENKQITKNSFYWCGHHWNNIGHIGTRYFITISILFVSSKSDEERGRYHSVFSEITIWRFPFATTTFCKVYNRASFWLCIQRQMKTFKLKIYSKKCRCGPRPIWMRQTILKENIYSV